MTPIPKGGMCMGCANWLRDCSGLKFNTMPVIAKDPKLGVVVVKCLEYKNETIRTLLE
jgi:hypothetical protein